MNDMNDDVVILSREEIIQKLEQGARERLNVSAEEFVDACRGGQIEPCEVLDLIILASLLPDDDRFFIPA
jgi:hypothetical protein